jgi:hypothetical protein
MSDEDSARHVAYQESEIGDEDFQRWLANLEPDRLPAHVYDPLWHHWISTPDYATTFLAWVEGDDDWDDDDEL